jgi:hypothetical protein
MVFEGSASLTLAHGIKDQHYKTQFGQPDAASLDVQFALAIDHPMAGRVENGRSREANGPGHIKVNRHQEIGPGFEHKALDDVTISF